MASLKLPAAASVEDLEANKTTGRSRSSNQELVASPTTVVIQAQGHISEQPSTLARKEALLQSSNPYKRTKSPLAKAKELDASSFLK